MVRFNPRFIPLAAMAAIILATRFGDAAPLPPLIDFQSVLLDEGGNLLPSGSTSIQFQILDEDHAPIYTETQNVDVVKGAASALIGNGSDAKGVSTGGIPDDIFAAGEPRYLQVQVAGRPPEDPMTIVPVPYAQWSQTCATVADGGVKPASIAKAAVGFEQLAPDVVGKLAAEMGKSQGMMTAQALNASGGASQIGLQAKLINSGSSTVQGALQDIDLSVKKRQEETTFLTGKLNEEVTNRTNAVKGVQGQLDMATPSNMKTAINNLQDVTSDINKIPGQLGVDHLNPNSSAISDLDMGGKKIIKLGEPSAGTDASTRKFVEDEDKKLQGKVDTINTTIGDINNIPGILKLSKMETIPAATSMPPLLSGEVVWGDIPLYKYGSGPNMITEGIKFIPFNEPETLAQNTCGDTSGHACNYAAIPANSALYFCKVGIKFNLQGHNPPQGNQLGVFATCEYTTQAKPSSINDGDGGNLDYAVQKGILVHVYDMGFNTPGDVSVLYNVYQIPVATQ